MIISRQAWVVVADGGRANIYKNIGEIGEVKLALVRSTNHHNEHTHELGRDQPGRLSGNSGHAKSALESTNLHQAAEDKFLKAVVEHLAQDVQSGQCKELVLIAPPHALGEIRKHLPASVSKIVVSEISKDYTHMAINELQKTLMNNIH
ncbi:host attachment protein [Zwartia vadi]|uniref:host attachment protein n=1 Tax=Zwartia vadi TaxID=3058168 RepID=UPI0025B4245D|nr:host attachment protein [Zwartia vadi]MDN3987689.1 host attachment protein [Zwartia vadi]